VIDLATVSANIFEFAAPRVQSNLLARNGWKRERREIIVGDGKRGGAMARRWIEATESYALSAYFATALQFQIAPLMNMTG
jgi:hypothetical protein